MSACCLEPATGSKFVTGSRILGLTVPAMVDVGPVAIGRESTIGDLAFAVLRRQFKELLRREPGTRLGDDIEELHDMRVAARRLRAALSLFSGYLDADFEIARSELRWVAAASERCAIWTFSSRISRGGKLNSTSKMQQRSMASHRDALRCRDAARERMLAVLDSERYDQLVAHFADILKHGPAAGTLTRRWSPRQSS